MTIDFTFRGMDSSAAIENFVQSKLPKIERLLESEPEPISLQVTCEANNTRSLYKVELRLKSMHYDLIAHHEGHELYAEIERVADILAHELQKAKEKRFDALKHRQKPVA